MRQLLEFEILPADGETARSLAAQALNFTMVDNVLYYVDAKKGGHRRTAVPQHLQRFILADYHAGKMAGHFSGTRLYATLCRHMVVVHYVQGHDGVLSELRRM